MEGSAKGRSSHRSGQLSTPGTEYVRPDAPLEAARPGRRSAVVGAALSLIGVIFSAFAAVIGAVVLVRVQVESSYATVQAAFEAGQYSDYAVPLVALASQILWVLLVFIGFLLLVLGLIRGYRRPWVWAAGVAGPAGMLLSLTLFIITVDVSSAAVS